MLYAQNSSSKYCIIWNMICRPFIWLSYIYRPPTTVIRYRFKCYYYCLPRDVLSAHKHKHQRVEKTLSARILKIDEFSFYTLSSAKPKRLADYCWTLNLTNGVIVNRVRAGAYIMSTSIYDYGSTKTLSTSYYNILLAIKMHLESSVDCRLDSIL